jgi:predicted enzyme related to lactoylglutathione lyase
MPVAVVSVPVTDQLAAKRFYTETLGFACLRDEAMGPTMRWIQLQPTTGGATIALVTWFEAMPPGSLHGVMLHVPDIDAEHARLEAAGVKLAPIGEEPWGRFTTLEDPDGNGWIVAQLTAADEIASRL